MTDKSAEDVLFKGGEIHPPKVRGTIEAWMEHKEDFNYKEEQGCIPAMVERELVDVACGDYMNFLDRNLKEDIISDWDKDGKRGELNEIFTNYWESNEELRERFKEISYWCHDASILINVKAAEEQGGIEHLIEKHGKQTIADVAYSGKQYLDGRDGGIESEDEGEEDQSSFGESRFPELYDVGVVNEHGNSVRSKLRGLVIAFTKDVDEIKGEGREFQIKWVQKAFLEWGHDKFEDEWIPFVVDNHMNDNGIYEAVQWAYNNHDDANSLMHKKFRGNYDLEVGNPDTDEMSKAFLDIEAPEWDEEDDNEETDKSKSKWQEFEEKAEELEHPTEEERESEDDDEEDSKWDKYEKESKEKYDNDSRQADTSRDSDTVDRDNNSDNGVSNSTGKPNDLSEWGEEVGTTDKVNKRSRTRAGSQSKVTETTQQSQSKDVQERQTTAGTADVECEDGGRPYPIEWPDVEPIDEFERNRIYEGNTFEWALKLPENSIDTLVTSPPYYALRDYDIEDAFPISGDFTCDHDWHNEFCTKCGAFLGQLGHEPDPATFVEHIVDLMDRYRRVLKPTGSLWLNIGDTYAGENFDGRVKANRKSRMMIPERVYRRMVQTGWHLRDYVIWVKKIWLPDDDLKGNGKPYAGSSRLADQWEPMARFTPEADHYSDVDSNRLKPPSFDGDLGTKGIEGKFREGEDTQRGKTYNELGTNPPDVWLINSDGYNGDHRAVFPEELPKRCLNITTPDRVCKRCGKPYEKEVHVEDGNILSAGGDYATYEDDCGCNEGHEPGVGFDPFLGSGTTAVAAANNGYDWAGVELSEKYQELARERIPTGRQVGLDQW